MGEINFHIGKLTHISGKINVQREVELRKKTIALQVLIPFIPAPRETINRRRSSENPPTVILTIRGLHLARG